MYAVHKAQHVVETEEVPAAVRSDESASTPIPKRKRSDSTTGLSRPCRQSEGHAEAEALQSN